MFDIYMIVFSMLGMLVIMFFLKFIADVLDGDNKAKKEKPEFCDQCGAGIEGEGTCPKCEGREERA